MRDEPISLADEQHLEWFFSLGQTAFERSTSGSMFERAELYSKSREYGIRRAPVLGSHGQVIGYENEIDARPTAETRPPAGYVPDINTLGRYAEASWALKRIERMAPRHALVLELWYGDRGQYWAGLEQPYGRAAALFHITHKGQTLLAAARREAAMLSLSDCERLENLIDAQKKRPKRERGQALAYCAQQAKLLELGARAAWHAVTLGHSLKRAKQLAAA